MNKTVLTHSTDLWKTIDVVLARRCGGRGIRENALAARLAAVEERCLRLWTHDRHVEVVRDEDIIVVRHLGDDVGLASTDQIPQPLQCARTVFEDGRQAHVVTL